MSIYATLCYLSAFFAVTFAMPTQQLIGIASADIVMNSCMDIQNSSPSYNSLSDAIAAVARPNETTLINLLKNQTARLNDYINVIQTNFSNWNIYSESQLKQLLQQITPVITIGQKQRNLLTEKINVRLNFTSQLAVYANFLKAQETDAVYGVAIPTIKNITKELVQTICTLKNLLQPPISSDDLRAYVTEDCNLPPLDLGGQGAPLKRVVTYQVLKMLTTYVKNVPLM